jgi:prephenate dehydrogenase
LDEARPTAGAAVADAGVVVLAMPVDRMPEVIPAITAHVPAGAVVTDVGSAKRAVVAEGEAAFGGRFLGGHPMAGSERHGIEAADAHLFEGAWWILTPTERTASDTYRTVNKMVGAVGANGFALPPEEHDRLVARLSHVPQLAASSLVDVAVAEADRDTLLGLAGPGFRDVTRIAASDPTMWISILRANRGSVLEALETTSTRLERVKELIEKEEWDRLEAFLADARRARLELFARPDLSGEPIGLTMLVPDRPGVLAQVTTAAADLRANIEDLRIVHSTEGGRGRLELIITGRAAAERLAEALNGLGYHVEPLVDQ